MQFGKFTVDFLVDGMFKLDGGAMFGVVPKPLWNKLNPADDQNRINMSLTCVLVQTPTDRVLIDTGVGDKWDQKNLDIYAIKRARGLVGELAALDLRPDDITAVILSHLHFDHTGGSTTRNSAGQIVPTFPNAKYYIQKKEFDFGEFPNQRTRASYLAENFLPLREHGKVVPLEGDARNFIPGFSVLVTGGHTPFHQTPVFESEGQKAIFLADLVPTTAHLRLPYIMGYDLYPLETYSYKEKLLKRLYEERWLCCFEHDPHVLAGYLVDKGKFFDLEPVALNPYSPYIAGGMTIPNPGGATASGS